MNVNMWIALVASKRVFLFQNYETAQAAPRHGSTRAPHPLLIRRVSTHSRW